METRRCTKCGDTKPLTIEFFLVRKNRPGGWQSQCRICTAARHADARRKKGETSRPYVRQHTPSGERLMALVDPVGPDKCWTWKGAKAGSGYGQIWDWELNHRLLVHRVSYEHNVGPIPDGLTIDHLCRNRLCVNPWHLEAVSIGVNVLRSPIAPAAVNARKTHCKHGHEFTPENTLPHSPSGRKCKTCMQDRDRRYYEEKKSRLGAFWLAPGYKRGRRKP